MHEVEIDPEAVSLYHDRLTSHANEITEMLDRLLKATAEVSEAWQDNSMVDVTEYVDAIRSELDEAVDSLELLKGNIQQQLDWIEEYWEK